jgi:hypothetical protein
MCIAIFRRHKKVAANSWERDQNYTPRKLLTIPRLNFLIHTEFIKFYDNGAKIELKRSNYIEYCKLYGDMLTFLNHINIFTNSHSSTELNNPRSDKQCLLRHKKAKQLLKRTVPFRHISHRIDVCGPDSEDNCAEYLSKIQLEHINNIQKPYHL